MTKTKLRTTLFYTVAAVVLVAYATIAYGNEARAAPVAQAAGAAPNLPATPYNYANINLPAHFFENGIRGGNQSSVISNDNTPANNPITDAGATLGRVLFYDTTLSATGTVSCASCHIQANGFSDPARLSLGVAGTTRRHSMALANARFNDNGRFFWDERANSLEAQVLMPFQDPVEMGLTLDQLNQLVATQPYYAELFSAAFGDATVNSDRISLALSQFIRSMVSANAKYDQGRALVDDASDQFPNFTAQENRGKRLFMRQNNGQIACSACHSTEVFTGEAPRRRGNSNATNNGIDLVSLTDFGVFESSGNDGDIGEFRVPSLRNIAVSGPYMHDGRFGTLEAVVQHYSGGIQSHPNLDPQLQNNFGNAGQYDFNAAEQAALVAFMNTLTDTTFLTDVRYSNPFTATGNEPAPEPIPVSVPDAAAPAPDQNGRGGGRDNDGDGRGNGGNRGDGNGGRGGRNGGGRGN